MTRIACCVCGETTKEAPDFGYVELCAVVPGYDARQFFGAHADCFARVLAPGVPFEIVEAARYSKRPPR